MEKAKGQVYYGPTEQEKDSIVFRKSIFAVKNIKAGEKLTEENVRVIRPGYGIKPKYYTDILGKTVVRDVDRGTPLSYDMFGEMP